VVPKRFQRTRKLRRVSVRTPGGRVAVHYENKPSGFRRCAWCGKTLPGIIRESLAKAPKSEKRISRWFGGYLCHKCLESSLKYAVISEWLASKPISA